MTTGTAIVVSVGMVVGASLLVLGLVSYFIYRVFKEM